MLGALIVPVLAALAVQAQEPEEEDLPLNADAAEARPQTLDAVVRYNLSHAAHVDRRTVAGVSIGFMDLLHAGLLDGAEDPFVARGLKWGFSGLMSIAVIHVAHEYGHVSSLSKIGHLDYILGFPEEPPEEREDLTFGRLAAQGLGLAERRSVGTSEEDWDRVRREFAGNPRGFNRFLMTAEGGGINQEQVISSMYGEKLRAGRMSYLDTPAWIWAASGTLLYPASRDEGDLARYADLVEDDGHSTSTTSIKSWSALRILGGTGIASIRGAILGLAGGGNGVVEPLAWDVGDDARIFWPEIESWLTREGPTLRVLLPVRWGEWTVEPSYERSLAGGDECHEGGGRLRWRASDLFSLEGSLHLSDEGGRWMTLEAEIRPAPWGALLLGLEGGRNETFRREIFGAVNDILEASERSVLVGVRLGVTF